MHPGAGTTSTTFAMDANATTDRESANGALVFAWAFGDGATASGITTAHQYGATGTYQVVLTVTDPGGLKGVFSWSVHVVAPGTLVQVTNTNDSGAGSLRQALASTPGSVVTFTGSMPMAINQLTTLVVDSPGMIIAGEPGVSVLWAGGNGNNPCLQVSASGVTIQGLSIAHCKQQAILFTGAPAGNTIAHVRMSSTGNNAIELYGMGHHLGPDVRITGALGLVAGNGLLLQASSTTVDGLLVDGTTGFGIQVIPGINAVVIQRVVIANNDKTGILVGANDVVLRHAVVVSNHLSGIHSQGTGATLRNVIAASNTNYGVLIGAGATVNVDFADVWGNGAGACSGAPAECTFGSSAIVADPMFVDAAAADYRLAPGSPCINSGTDVGIDVNDALAGNYNGSAPDIGAFESP